MKRTYKQFLKYDNDQNIQIQQFKKRRLNNLNNVNDNLDNINKEIYNLRYEMQKIKLSVEELKKSIEDIQIFVGMKHKKFDSTPSYIC